MGLFYRTSFLGALITIGFLIIVWLENNRWHFWSENTQVVSEPAYLKHVFQENIAVGQIESNCGIRETCEGISVPVYLSTGEAEDLRPQLCVGGKYIIQTGVNGGGRGLNAAILEPNHFQVVAVRNFDTYRQDSAIELDSWLYSLLEDDILIIFSTDEASARLNQTTRVLLNFLGSGKIQDLSFRAQWYLITQKTGKGFSVYEGISYPNKKSWGDGLEFRGCVPQRVPKELVTVDPPPRDLSARDHFCHNKTDDMYRAVCTQSRFQVFSSSLLTNRSLIGNMVFSLPIYLFAGQEFEVFVAALDSLVHQPGVLLSGITVVYSEGQDDVVGVAKLYHVKSIVAAGLDSWDIIVEFVRHRARTLLPRPEFFIVIDRDCIPSPDFIFYLAQTAPTLLKDNTVSAISAWSPNCYSHEGDVHAAYRIAGNPRYAALLRKHPVDGDIVVPDVSRVQGPAACHPPSLHSDNWIDRPQDLTQERFFHKLVIFQQRSVTIDVEKVLSSCNSLTFDEGGSYVLYYREDEELLLKIVNCLGLIGNEFGKYQTLVRVTVPSKGTMLIINSNSSFYKARPIH